MSLEFVGGTQPDRTCVGGVRAARALRPAADVASTLRRYVDLGVEVFQVTGFEPAADLVRFGELIELVRGSGDLVAADARTGRGRTKIGAGAR